MVGASGVGKSHLLQAQVLPRLREHGWTPLCISDYSEFPANLENNLRRYFKQPLAFENLGSHLPPFVESDCKIVVVLDQFEQFLGLARHATDESERRKNQLLKYLRMCRALGNSIIINVIVVRKEWYFDLKFLEDLVPGPSQCIEILGLSRDEVKNADSLRDRLLNVTRNAAITDRLLHDLVRSGEILPVEATIVGHMVERAHRDGGMIDPESYLQAYIGTDGMVRNYFRGILATSPNYADSLAVLFALSTGTNTKRQFSCRDIAEIIHRSTDRVRESLGFLSSSEIKLVREITGGQYEVAHDYVADKITDLSGIEMAPPMRDNILFFSQRQQRTPPRPASAVAFSDYFLTFLVVLLVVRLYSPLFHFHWDWINPLRAYEATGHIFDPYYLPVFISHLAWSIYVCTMYRRFLRFLNEGRGGRFLSKVTVVLCTACVTTAAFMPHWWLLSIGVGGLGVGIKWGQLCCSRRISKVAKREFGTYAFRTIGNLILVSLGGLALIYFVGNTPMSQALVASIQKFSLAVALIMTWYMIHVSSHLSAEMSSIMLGLHERTPAGVPSLDVAET